MSDQSQSQSQSPQSQSQETFLGSQGFSQLKTHFPSARVKKLMQSDEDIGKVSQATPLVVGRALELFMCALVEHASTTARKQGASRVGADTLDKAIKSEDTFDFLEGVCDKYLNPQQQQQQQQQQHD